MDFAAAYRLIEKHRDAGVLVDAQLLLLLLVGQYNHALVRQFKRTASEFADLDLKLMCELMHRCRKIFVTPHILTEVDNFADALDSNREFRFWLRDIVLPNPSLRESAPRAYDLARQQGFPRLGLADCSVIQLARRRRLVITVDFDLYRQLGEERLPVINLNHLRASAYGWDRDLQTLFPPSPP